MKCWLNCMKVTWAWRSVTCDQALFFSRRCSQRKNECLIQLLVESSVKSPESGLFSDWSGNKRQHKAVCTLRACFAPLMIPANEATSGKLWLAHSYLMASLTLSLTDTLIGARQTIQQVIVSGFPFFFALPPPRKKRKPDRRLVQA